MCICVFKLSKDFFCDNSLTIVSPPFNSIAHLTSLVSNVDEEINSAETAKQAKKTINCGFEIPGEGQC